MQNIFSFSERFYTAVHKSLTEKLNYYGVRGKAYNWFSSYLKNRTQFITINGFNSELKEINGGAPQGSMLGPLLFLIYINDLLYFLKFCQVHHFDDDFNFPVKVIKKQVNKDLKTLIN